MPNALDFPTIYVRETTALYASVEHKRISSQPYRRMAENGFAPPPLGNFADISYLVEIWKPSLLRNACTLWVGALVCKSLQHMLFCQIKKK